MIALKEIYSDKNILWPSE